MLARPEHNDSGCVRVFCQCFLPSSQVIYTQDEPQRLCTTRHCHRRNLSPAAPWEQPGVQQPRPLQPTEAIPHGHKQHRIHITTEEDMITLNKHKIGEVELVVVLDWIYWTHLIIQTTRLKKGVARETFYLKGKKNWSRNLWSHLLSVKCGKVCSNA